MRIKILEQIKFKLSGRAVPVIKVVETTDQNKVLSLQTVGDLRRRDNSLVNPWDETGYEIDKNCPPIPVIDEKGIPILTFIVSAAGKTINLYTEPRSLPNLEVIIGHAACMDDIADSMDLGKSMRNLAIGIVIGILLGVFVFGPMFSSMMR